MNFRKSWAIPLALTGILLTIGCTTQGTTAVNTPPGSNAQDHKLNDDLTWEQAKAATQKKELEIAELIPKDLVQSIDQKGKGMLFPCGKDQHQWAGWTVVTLHPNASFSAALKSIEQSFGDSDRGFSITVDPDDGFGDPQLKLLTKRNDGENYLVGTGLEGNQLQIDSSSPCFTLAEGIYPGGDF